MITRYAIFEGAIPQERQDAFETAVVERLLPAVRQMPGQRSAVASFPRDSDADAPGIAMFLVTTYPDLATLDGALKGAQRLSAQKITRDIFDEFVECRVYHHVTESRTAP